MNKFAIAQVRSHVAIHASRKVRTTTQMQAPFLILVLFQEQPRRRNRPGLIFFGGQYDPFHILPQLPMEQELPGSLSMVKSYMFASWAQPGMNKFIWPHGIHDPCFFSGMLLLACSNLDASSSSGQSARTLRVRLDTIRLIREKLSNPDGNFATIQCIGAVACLANSAMARGDEAGIAEYHLHHETYHKLMRHRSSQQKCLESNYGLNVIKVIAMFNASRVCGMPATGLATTSHVNFDEMQTLFGNSCPTASHDLLSPIYNEAKQPFPGVKSERLRTLLEVTQCTFDFWITSVSASKCDLTYASARESCKTFRQRIEDIAYSLGRDGIYESCHWTASLMVRSVENCESWRESAQRDTTLHSCRHALSRTNLGDLWGTQIGLLYWVVLVMHCASFQTPSYPFYHSIFSRLIFELTYRYDDWYGAVRPLTNLQSIMQVSRLAKESTRTSDPRVGNLFA